jgi:hypothetical protein
VILATDSGTVLTLNSTRVVKLVAASPVVQVYTPAAAGAARRMSRSPVWCSTRVPEVLALLGSSQVASSPAPSQPSVTLAPAHRRENDNLIAVTVGNVGSGSILVGLALCSSNEHSQRAVTPLQANHKKNFKQIQKRRCVTVFCLNKRTIRSMGTDEGCLKLFPFFFANVFFYFANDLSPLMKKMAITPPTNMKYPSKIESKNFKEISDRMIMKRYQATKRNKYP